MKYVFHQSEIAEFLICGKRWNFRYVLQIPTKPSSSLTLGSAVDDTVSHNLAQKVSSKKDLPIEELLQFFTKNFSWRSARTNWYEDESPYKTELLGINLLKLYHERMAPKIQPVAVQQRFHIEIVGKPYEFAGMIDVTDSNSWVRDTKTSARSYPEDAVSRAIQPALYDLAYRSLYGKPPKGFAYDVLIKTTVPKTQEVQGQVTPEDHDFLYEAADSLYDHIVKNVIPRPADENHFFCSQKYCPYWDICKGKKRE